MAALTYGQVERLAVQAGFSASQAVTMAAIAGAESRLDPNAHNPVPPDDSYGLWQINMIGSLGPDRRARFGIASDSALFDPATNARAAKAVFDQQGYKAWSTYSSGSYRQYLPQALVAAGGAAADTGASSGTPATSGGSSSGPFPTFGPSWLPWNYPADLGNAAAQQQSNLLSGVRAIVLEGAFLALAIGLVGFGVIRATGAQQKLKAAGATAAKAAVLA